MEAVCIDGTIIECDQIKHQQGGVTLHKQEPKQKVKGGGGGQSEKKKKEKKQKKKKKQGGGGSKSRTVGFVPYDKLMYVIPDEITHNIDELDELPA